MSLTLDAARRYTAAGLAVLPLAARGKNPILAGWQTRGLANDAELARWFGGSSRLNIGVLCGAASGGLLVVDWDEPGALDTWRKDTTPAATFEVRSGRRGSHMYYRLRELPAHKLKLAGGAGDVLCDGAQVVAPPSIHPATGRPYVVACEAPILALACLEALRLPLAVADPPPPPASERSPSAARIGAAAATAAGVVARFNATHTAADVLSRNGYTRCGARWLRPGVSRAEHTPSVIVFADDGSAYSHSSADALGDGHTHTPFSLACKLEHGDDFLAALSAASVEMGGASLGELEAAYTAEALATGGESLARAAGAYGRRAARDALMGRPVQPFNPTPPAEIRLRRNLASSLTNAGGLRRRLTR